ncbi:MAG TPA: hypothetical protein IGS52_17620 [Oscillatoriaceae cyanobacterium M33_DOE_052]|nr:hypothetical protein [Oscillatoriaceae cyanobacterium M33_DOE_052]
MNCQGQGRLGDAADATPEPSGTAERRCSSTKVSYRLLPLARDWGKETRFLKPEVS